MSDTKELLQRITALRNRLETGAESASIEEKVQRGTIHNWVNRGTDDCIIAFVLVSAKPVTAAGKPLHAVG